MQSYSETATITFHPHGLETFSHSLCVAVLAALADLRAACHRVPGQLGPLNLRSRRHSYFPMISCAILTAVGAPFGLPAAKQNRYSGVFLEFLSAYGFAATRAK